MPSTKRTRLPPKDNEHEVSVSSETLPCKRKLNIDRIITKSRTHPKVLMSGDRNNSVTCASQMVAYSRDGSELSCMFGASYRRSC